MAGTGEWRYTLKTNIGEILTQMKDLQNRVDKLENGEHNINLNIDTKKLEKVISNLDKMLESIGKGTGDFKQFENLSAQINGAIDDIKKFNKSFGDINDSGVNELLVSVRNIDSSLSSLNKTVSVINDNFKNIGKTAEDNTASIKEETKALEQAAKQAKVDQAAKDQLAAYKKIHDIKLKIAKAKDPATKQSLVDQQAVYQKEYEAAVKILTANSELYSIEKQTNQLTKIRLGYEEQIARYKASQKESKLSNLQSSIDKYTKDYDNRKIKPTDENRSAEYDQALVKYKASIDALVEEKKRLTDLPMITDAELSKFEALEKTVKTNADALKAFSSAQKGSTELSRAKEIDKINKYLADNTRISEEAKTKLRAMLKELENNGASVNLEKLHAEFLRITNDERTAGNEGKRFLDVIKDKAWYGWAAQIASYFSLQDMIRYFKEGATVVKEFDDGLTNISYTMDVTKSQLDGIGQSVLDLSKDLKSSIDNSMQVAKIYANMNTTAEEIKKLSEPTLIMTNLTGFDAATMADDIQAVTQQFEIAAEDSMHIADVYDTVSKSIRVDYAKGIEAIAESVQVAGSTAKMAGLEFEDLAALTGKVVETTRLAGAQVGNGMKTIFTRLSRVGELSDEVDNETLSKASESLHQIGVEVYNADGSYRSFKTIMSELAAKWGDLTDAEKSNISFNIAATRQTNLLNAVLSNFSDSMELAEQATNSNGNALQNNEKYIDSMSGKLQNLENVGKTAWIHILDSEALKSGIDVLSMLIELLDKLASKAGLIGTIGLGAGLFTGIQNVGRSKKCLDLML